jgi:hypothetical protein
VNEEAHVIRIPTPEWVKDFRLAYRTLPSNFGWLAIAIREHLASHGFGLNL